VILDYGMSKVIAVNEIELGMQISTIESQASKISREEGNTYTGSTARRNSCLFLTWYQSSGPGHPPHAATRALIQNFLFVRPPSSPAISAVGLPVIFHCVAPLLRLRNQQRRSPPRLGLHPVAARLRPSLRDSAPVSISSLRQWGGDRLLLAIRPLLRIGRLLLAISRPPAWNRSLTALHRPFRLLHTVMTAFR
jgi:hypothetical protein